MLQAVLTKPEVIEFVDVPVPEVGSNQVLIKMVRMGICGTDIQVYHGKHKYMTYPVVQGHEGSGVVAAVGRAVREFSVGEKVTVQPQSYCGKCYPCRNGQYNVCERLTVMGVQENGLAAEYFLTDASKVLKLPETIDFDQAVMAEPTAVAVGAIRKCGGVKDANVVVIGAGPIGNLVAQVARAQGAKGVMITDIQPQRLQIAEQCHIDYCINTAGSSLEAEMAAHFGTDGADVIFDCAGVKRSINDAIHAARRGSKIVIVGNYKESVDLELVLVQRNELTMYGILMYIREDFETAIQLLAEDKLNAKALITDYFPMFQLIDAYRHIDTHPESVIKVILKFDEEQ